MASIKWQDIIEPNPDTKPDILKRASTILDRALSSSAMQREAAKILSEKALIPKNKKWEEDPRFNSVPPDQRDMLLKVLSKRKDPQKIFLYVVDGTEGGKKVDNSYQGVGHILTIDISKPVNLIPKRNAEGKTFYDIMPLDEMIAHELGHVVPGQKMLRGEIQINSACYEELAIKVENEHRRETNPSAAPRHAYIDARLRLGEMLKKPGIEIILNPNDVSDPAVGTRRILFQDTLKSVLLDTGCKELNPKLAFDQAVDIMREKGISLNGVAFDSQVFGGRIQLDNYRKR